MKPLRFPAFRYSFATVSALLTLSSGQLWSVPATWVGGSTDWGNAASWTRTPAGVPTVADTAIFAVHSSSNTDPHNVQLRGNRQILGITPTNAATTDSLNILGGDGNYTLGIGAGGITHTRSAMVIGSVTDGQKVNISLLDTQTWSSSAAAGGGTAAAMIVHNDVSAGVAGPTTLTLTGGNTGHNGGVNSVVSNVYTFGGTLINGTLSDGAGTVGIFKDGVGAWGLTGATSYSGPTTVNAGRLNLNVGNLHGPGVFTVASAGTLYLRAGGPTGFTSERLSKLFQTGNFSTGSGILLETNAPIFSAVGSGDYRLIKSGTAELALSGISSRTGLTDVTAGILRVRDLQSGGVPSAIGASSNLGSNLLFTSGTRLIYDGPSTATDRLFTTRGTFSIEAAGTGPLQFTNTGVQPQTNTSSRTLVLLGSNQDDNLIAGALGTRTDTSITKRGNGSWRIIGNQPATATTRVEEGQLTFDFSSGTDPFSPATLLLNGGKTILRGNGATTKTVATLNLGSTLISAFHLRLENGFALTATTLAGGQTQRNDLIDLSAGANNSFTVGALSGAIANVNGVIMVGASPNGRANTVLRAADGSYGFLALSNGTSGTAQKVGSLVEPLPGVLTMASNTTNYRLKAGDYVGSGNLDFSTLALDTTNGAIDLNIGGGKLKSSGQGKALLFFGPNNVTIDGNVDNDAASSDNALWFHNYLQFPAKLNLDVGLGGTSQTVIFGGTGTTEYSGFGFTGTFDVNDGVFRFTTRQAIQLNDASPTFKIGSGAVLEIGERLQDSTVTPAHLVKTVGNDVRDSPPTNVPGNIRLYGDAGLSAYSATPGEKRIVYFSYIGMDEAYNPVLTPQPLIWGSNYFLTISEGEPNTDGDNSFMLSSPTSNAMLEVQNTINLNGRSRTVDVANGSDPIDARLSGTLTGDAASGIVKRGPGTLQLTGINFYKGETRVMEGTLMIDSSSLDAQSRLWIDSGATLQILSTSTVHVSSVFIDGVQYFGTITHPSITGGGTLISNAPLTPYAQWVVDKALSAPQSAPTFDADSDGLRNLLEYAVGSEPKTPNGSVFAITGSAPRQIKFNHPSGRTDITIYLESSPTLAAPWTTIATSTAGAAFTHSVTNVTASEVSNQVTITDSRTPAATVMFYRLRVEK